LRLTDVQHFFACFLGFLDFKEPLPMIGRMILVVLGLCFVQGVGSSQAQETGGGDQAKNVTTVNGTDWKAVGTQGAVAAGGREAVAAGLGILKEGGNAAVKFRSWCTMPSTKE
jgi:hypothetical protein